MRNAIVAMWAALFASGCGDQGATETTRSRVQTGGASDPVTAVQGSAPELLPATPLMIEAGCATFVGNHLKHPDGEHLQTYEFCADGTMTKFWDPVPAQDFPQAMTCPGSWSADSRGGLEIQFECIDAGFANHAVEVYELAFMYDNGTKLDMFEGRIQLPPGDGSSVIGDYASSLSGIIDMGGGTVMYMEMWGDHATRVTDGRWENREHEVVQCEGFACVDDYNSEQDTETSGSVDMPGQLYQLGDLHVFQVSQYHVMQRQ